MSLGEFLLRDDSGGVKCSHRMTKKDGNFCKLQNGCRTAWLGVHAVWSLYRNVHCHERVLYFKSNSFLTILFQILQLQDLVE